MFTLTANVPRITVKNLETIEALAPGTAKLHNIVSIETEDQALVTAKGMVELLLERYEYISSQTAPVIVETDKGWDITLTVYGD